MKAFDVIHLVNGKKQIVTMQANSEKDLDLRELDVYQVIGLSDVGEWGDDVLDPTDEDLFYIYQNAEKLEEEQKLMSIDFLSVADQAAIALSYIDFIKKGSSIENHMTDYGYPDEMDARTSLAYGELLNMTVFKDYSIFDLKDLI